MLFLAAQPSPGGPAKACWVKLAWLGALANANSLDQWAGCYHPQTLALAWAEAGRWGGVSSLEHCRDINARPGKPPCSIV